MRKGNTFKKKFMCIEGDNTLVINANGCHYWEMCSCFQIIDCGLLFNDVRKSVKGIRYVILCH
jgi:hypothetical protein